MNHVGKVCAVSVTGMLLLGLSGCSVPPKPKPTMTASPEPTVTAIFSPASAAIAVGDVWVASLRYVNDQTPELCAALGVTIPALSNFETNNKASYGQVKIDAEAAYKSCSLSIGADSVIAAIKSRTAAEVSLQDFASR